MSREIKFRGLDIKGNWYYGLLSIREGSYFISNDAGMPFAYEVRPETVGQYTGLTDKNGVEIYKGDIISFPTGTSIPREIEYEGKTLTAYEKTPNNIGIVNFHEGSFMVGKEEKPKWFGVLNYSGNLDSWQVEVIGNIYENPELLK